MIAWGLLALALAGWLLHVAALRARLFRQQRERARRREAAERAPQAARSGHDAWFDALGEVVLRLDAQGRVLAANPAARRVLGIRAAGRLDAPLPMLAVYRDPDWIEALQKALAKPGAPHALPPMEAGGKVLAPRLAPLGDGEALMLCLDITREQRLERQRRDFLANLMHDLKTPLTSLLGYARSLASFGEDADFRREAIEVIGAEARRVNDLLEALLELEAIGCEPASGARADAAAALAAIARLKSPQAKACGCAIRVAAKDAPLQVAIGERELGRVLENLVGNALKHGCPADGAEITLACRRRGAMAEIEVADCGPGIPARHLGRVMERFYRVDGARSSGGEGGSRGGHGLGLAIAREIVERAGGRLRLENREPRGLRAVVRLPLAGERDPSA